jgi:phenylacetic acid degradation operon negative regulatory protein
MSVAMKPTAKSLVLDLLSTIGGHSMPVRALVAAAELFAIEENSLRVALARLLAIGILERDERGEYRLGSSANAVQQQVASWRRIEERARPWQGAWIGVHFSAAARGPRTEARRRERALRFLGFRELAAGLAVRPENLVGGLDDVQERLVKLGLARSVPVFVISELASELDLRARSLWDTAALVEHYRTSCRALAESEARLPDLTDEHAMVESFLLGGRVIRDLVYDPLLPEPIVPQAERRALVSAMQRYDRIGHGFWRPFFRSYRVSSLRAPVHAKIDEGAVKIDPVVEMNLDA